MNIDALNLEHQMDLELSRNSFPYFFEHVLGYQLTNHQQEWNELLQNNSKNVIMCSRGHGKSVFMYSWVVWNLCFQKPPYKMVYMSSNQKQTNMHMKEIGKLFNLNILKGFKPDANKGWAVEEMILKNGNSIVGRSTRSQYRGLHPDEIIIDDALKEFSLSGIQAVNDWFFGDVSPTIKPHVKIRVIGTPFSYVDLYQKLNETGQYDLQIYPCLNALNEPLWPEVWTYDQLMEKKAEMGSLKFMREMMCVPVTTGASLFAPEHLENAKRKDLVLKPMRREGYKYYVGIDPAISTNGDYNVITVLEVDEAGNKSVVYVDRAKNVEFRENLDKVRMIGKVFNPEVVLFETNTFAKSFTQELRNISDLNVKDFNTTRKKKQDIILNLQMNFENSNINLPYGNEESRKVTSAMIGELSMFAITESGRFEGVGAHDDMVMSLALANAATQRATENFLLLDDLGLFNDRPQRPFHPMGGIVGLNF